MSLSKDIPFFFELIITLVVVGFFMWLVNVLPFIAPPMKAIVNGVVLLLAVLWLLFALYNRFFAGGHLTG